jgi:iron complex transport system ATP-binding protein
VALTAHDRFVAPDQLTGVAERICARLGGAPARVGESTYVLGLAARLWSATLGPLVRSGVLPDPAAFHVWDDQGAVELALTEPRGWTGVTTADLHREVMVVLRTVIEPSRLSHRLLWGNVASALAATPRVMGLPEAEPWAQELLTFPPLQGEVVDGRRTTCCLFYEAGGGLCGDCCFTQVPARA